MLEELSAGWLKYLKPETEKEYYKNLTEFVEEEYKTKEVFPPKDEIFNALKYTSYKDARVVILGQDPYPTKGVANGLAFSVNPDIKIPRSLMNIYKELHTDLGCFIPNNGCLTKWAKQGVLLLNTSLTVLSGKPNSHAKKGWERFTNKIIGVMNEKTSPVVFILWGGSARSKKILIKNPIHLILESAHPSPLSASRGFFGTKPFSKTNEFLIKNGLAPIDWQIENL